jgi:hypothetical protein
VERGTNEGVQKNSMPHFDENSWGFELISCQTGHFLGVSLLFFTNTLRKKERSILQNGRG